MTFNLVLVLPMALLVLASLAGCLFEGVPLARSALRDRLRLHKPTTRTWLWTAALSAFMYGGRWSIPVAFLLALTGVAVEKERTHRHVFMWAVGLALFFGLSWILWQEGPRLRAVQLHQQPEYLEDFLSRLGPDEFMGIPLAGQWWVALYYLVVVMLANVGGEELWWRGYLLPRQERAHGQLAWLVHGLLWAAFHIFFQWTLWDMVRMVPTCCALSFVVQHTRNTWPGIVAHAFGNSPLLFQIMRAVTG